MTPSLPDRLTGALARLTASVDDLEGAAENRASAEVAYRELQADHARLAAELGAALARTRGLLDANGEVSDRLDRATATVRAVLAEFDAEEGGEDVDAAAAVAEPEPARRAGGGRGD